jgi:type II restriction enzyme
MSVIHCNSLKAPSSAKTDITLVIHDIKTNQTPHLGFSIKSQLGNASTLLNAGKTTNLKYMIVGMSDSLMEEINAITTGNKLKRKLMKIEESKLCLKFDKVCNEIFSDNLILIDSRLDEILGALVLLNYYSSESKLAELVEEIERINPLQFNLTNRQKFYSYKMKRFLTDVAVGMMPNTVWNGLYDTTGGYLIVKDSGDILCYHLYNKNEFEDYLFYNTKFETASTSRHQFGVVYKEGDRFFMNLNIQIRFKK